MFCIIHICIPINVLKIVGTYKTGWGCPECGGARNTHCDSLGDWCLSQKDSWLQTRNVSGESPSRSQRWIQIDIKEQLINLTNLTMKNFQYAEEPFLHALQTTLDERYTPQMDVIYRVIAQYIIQTLIDGYNKWMITLSIFLFILQIL